MQNGWTANHGSFRLAGAYISYVAGFAGYIHDNYITINWGDGNTSAVDMKILSRDYTTGTASSVCSSVVDQTLAICKDSTISAMGEWSSSDEWKPLMSQLAHPTQTVQEL